jgi:glycosyltransferase involved in cell wall biosynthesis
MLTILLPVHNTENRITKCLESLSNQSDKNFLLIISDNKSTDGSLQIIKEFQKKTKINNTLYEQNINLGAASNWNFLLSKLDTEFFVFMDSEDEISENYVENINLKLRFDPQLEAIIPKFYELGINSGTREMPITSFMKLQHEMRLPLLLSISNNAGIAYLNYSVFSTAIVKNMFELVLIDANKFPSKSQCGDIVLSWMIALRLKKIVVDDNIELKHYSKVIVDGERLLLNRREYEMGYGYTNPAIYYEALAIFERLILSDSLVMPAVKNCIDSYCKGVYWQQHLAKLINNS